MRIALLANLKENAPRIEGVSEDFWDDLDGRETIESVLAALKSGGHRAEFLEANILPPYNLIKNLETFKPDLCFNIAEGHSGDAREAQVPAVLEMLGLPYTGSRVTALALSLDKPMTKRLLHYHDLPTPEFQVFGRADEPVNADLLTGKELKYPMFLKPSREGTGMGVTGKSVVYTLPELRERLGELLHRYQQPVLCERFIRGREITVGVTGNLKPTAARRLNDRTAPAVLPKGLIFFPPLEIDMDKYPDSEGGVYTNRIKVALVHDFYWTCPACLDKETEDTLFRLTAAVFRVTGCCDVARVDFRLDRENKQKPYILEINPLPGLNPEYSDLCIEARASGWAYEELINHIVDLAARRNSLTCTQNVTILQ